jgi:hypothetical protein
MFQFYYLFSQYITYINDIGLKPCCIAFGNVRFLFGKTWEKWGIPRTTDVSGAVCTAFRNALILVVYFIFIVFMIYTDRCTLFFIYTLPYDVTMTLRRHDDVKVMMLRMPTTERGHCVVHAFAAFFTRGEFTSFFTNVHDCVLKYVCW